VLEVNAVSDLSGILRQINKILRSNRNLVSYLMKGRLVTASFVDLNFADSGMIELPVPAKSKY
jgi:hypothetical protein